MPHFSIEYSANLEFSTDMQALCEKVHAAALATGVFPKGGTRVRAHRCDAYTVADQHPDNAFLHMTISIGAGRTQDTKRAAGEAIWSATTDALVTLFDTPHFALTMEIREIDPALSWKKNSIHPRLAAGETDAPAG